MDPVLILALISVGIFAGTIGAIFGLGGGIIFVPFLTMIFGLAANQAIAVSLIGIVATSVGASSTYIKEGKANVRLGILLELTTSVGAIIGALLAGIMANWILLCIFSLVLIYSAIHMMRHEEHIIENTEEFSGPMVFPYVDDYGKIGRYKIDNLRIGLAGCAGAGILASMTGVGGGAIKVPLMNIHMHVPIKTASATSSYMIGITAFSGAIIFLMNGHVILDYAAGIAIGAFLGALIGTQFSKRIKANNLRKYFALILLIIAVLELLKSGGIL